MFDERDYGARRQDAFVPIDKAASFHNPLASNQASSFPMEAPLKTLEESQKEIGKPAVQPQVGQSLVNNRCLFSMNSYCIAYYFPNSFRQIDFEK